MAIAAAKPFSRAELQYIKERALQHVGRFKFDPHYPPAAERMAHIKLADAADTADAMTARIINDDLPMPGREGSVTITVGPLNICRADLDAPYTPEWRTSEAPPLDRRDVAILKARSYGLAWSNYEPWFTAHMRLHEALDRIDCQLARRGEPKVNPEDLQPQLVKPEIE
jgi:hypothetical protein